MRIPKVRGQGIAVAEMSLMDAETRIAKVRILANIKRAFSLKSPPGSIILQEKAEFAESIKIDLDPEIDVRQIRVFTESPSVAAWIESPKEDERFGKLIITGKRTEVLDAKQIRVRLSYAPQGIDDDLFIRMLDGMQVRSIPAKPPIENGRVSFHLYRAVGFEVKITARFHIIHTLELQNGSRFFSQCGKGIAA